MSINATLIGQMISFALLVWFTMKYVWPPLIQALDERKQRIADGLAAAERGNKEKDLAEQRAKTVLKEAKDQAAEIVSQAQKRANDLEEEAKAEAKSKGEQIIAAAHAEVEQEITQAREALKIQVANLSLVAAEQILKREIDQQKHQDIINDVANQLGQA